jgi:hypothetical protein
VLGHFIEEEGVPTASISFIRSHTEVIRPPRALWVPFDIGRTLGPPNDAAFQRRVLLALMRMFEAPAGPLLEDFPEDEPETSDEIMVLTCPVDFAQDVADTEETDQLQAAFRREMRALRPWYDMGVTKHQRTAVGASGIDLEALGDFIYAFARGEEPENPRKEISLAYTLKFAVVDLKAYYIEGITSQPGQAGASSQRLTDWFWSETVAGKVLMELRKVGEANADSVMNQIGIGFIVPDKILRRYKN